MRLKFVTAVTQLILMSLIICLSVVRCVSQRASVRDHLCERGRRGEQQQTKRRWQLEKDQRGRREGLQAGLHW